MSHSYDCYLCGGSCSAAHVHPEFGLPVYRCSACGLLQTETVPHDFLSRYYSDAYSTERSAHVSEAYLEFAQKRGLDQRSYIIGATGIEEFTSVLDFGSGFGGALTAFPDSEKVAFEIDPEASKHLTDRGDVTVLDRAALDSDACDERFDLIILSHVAEHFADPIHELEKLQKKLKPGGFLFLEVPTEDEIVLQLQTQNLRPGVGHLFHFDKSTLTKLLADVRGYDLVDVTQCGVHRVPFYERRDEMDFDHPSNDDGLWLRAVLRRQEEVIDGGVPRKEQPSDTRIYDRLLETRRRQLVLAKSVRKGFDLLGATLPQHVPAASRFVGLDRDGSEAFLGLVDKVVEQVSKDRKQARQTVEILKHAKEAVVRSERDAHRSDDMHKELSEQLAIARKGQEDMRESLEALRQDALVTREKDRQEYQAAVAELRQGLAAKDKQATKLKGNIAEQGAELKALQEQLSEYKSAVKQANDRIKGLGERRAEAQHALWALRHSTTFRLGEWLTYPLRFLKVGPKAARIPAMVPLSSADKERDQSPITVRQRATQRPSTQEQSKPVVERAKPQPKLVEVPAAVVSGAEKESRALDIAQAREQIQPFYERHGFAMMQGVLNPNEAVAVSRSFQKDLVLSDIPEGGHTTFDIAAVYPPGEEYAFDPRVLSAVRNCLGEDIRFLQWATYQLNHMSFPWHRDGPFRQFGVGFDWDESEYKYSIGKIIVYLDCRDFAMALYPRTHKEDIDRTKIGPAIENFAFLDPDMQNDEIELERRPYLVRVKPGDALVFDQRVYHCGRLIDPKTGQFTKHIPGDKSYLSYTYGADNPHSYRFFAYFNRERGFNINPMHIRLVERLGREGLLLSTGQDNYFDQYPEQRENLWLPEAQSA